MARAARNTKTDSRTAWLKLEAKRDPYWTVITQGLAVGYRKVAKGGGTWSGRWRDQERKQHDRSFGAADDFSEADGTTILTFT